MNRYFFFPFLMLCFMATSCTTNVTDDFSEKPTKTVEMNLRLAEIRLVDNSTNDNESLLDFSLYLDRPDLSLSEPENPGYLLTVDLPKALQPRLMYASDVSDKVWNSGRLCDRPRFPHVCEIILDKKNLKSEYTYLIKVAFEDDTYAEKEITVQYPQTIAKPEILEPTSIPSQGDTITLKFKDVGATSYEVVVDMCNEYKNDGINPCFDFRYNLVREGENFVFASKDDINFAEVALKDGIIELKSGITFSFKESVNYSVKAILKGKTESGVATVTEVTDAKIFSLKGL